MNSFAVLADPVRRQILELLLAGEMPVGTLAEAIQRDHDITQAAISQHLKVLRDNRFARVRVMGNRRLYSVEPEPFQELQDWLDRFTRGWMPVLGALGAEIERGKAERGGVSEE